MSFTRRESILLGVAGGALLLGGSLGALAIFKNKSIAKDTNNSGIFLNMVGSWVILSPSPQAKTIGAITVAVGAYLQALSSFGQEFAIGEEIKLPTENNILTKTFGDLQISSEHITDKDKFNEVQTAFKNAQKEYQTAKTPLLKIKTKYGYYVYAQGISDNDYLVYGSEGKAYRVRSDWLNWMILGDNCGLLVDGNTYYEDCSQNLGLKPCLVHESIQPFLKNIHKGTQPIKLYKTSDPGTQNEIKDEHFRTHRKPWKGCPDFDSTEKREEEGCKESDIFVSGKE